MNLLPPEIIKDVRKEYKRRFLTIAFALLSFSAIIWVVTSLPYLFSVHFAKVETDREMIGIEKANLASTTSELSDEFGLFSREMELLKPGAGHASTTDLVKTIISAKPSGVVMRSFLFNRADKTSQAVISGVASNRESLLTFGKNLSDLKIFSAVNLPVSDFSKKTDIDYSITLTITN